MAKARNTPESRIAGMAMMAPMATTISPANSSASSHGMPIQWAKWPIAAAPTAAKPYWQSETSPDTRTRSPTEMKRMTSSRPNV